MDDYAVDEEEECECMKMVTPVPQWMQANAEANCECVRETKRAQQPAQAQPTAVEIDVPPLELEGKLSTSEEHLRSQPFSPLKHCIPKRSLTLPRILVPQSSFGSSGGGSAGSGRSGGGRSGF
ncbi:unnamed protein product [Ceratitis capitata]|uniref:(Mediterranean fruit fly) hypothetical protein n=1 Tax=Ceratitis capitata TaxID=7213 RepID=A0A811UFJ2_CERCA|nr:unnamed protein product [Ceratitis capitata]